MAVFKLMMRSWFHLVASLSSLHHPAPSGTLCSQHSALCTQRFSEFKSVILLLYFSGDQKALTFAVRCWDALQLEDVEKNLHLQKHKERESDPHGCSCHNHHLVLDTNFYLTPDFIKIPVVV